MVRPDQFSWNFGPPDQNFRRTKISVTDQDIYIIRCIQYCGKSATSSRRSTYKRCHRRAAGATAMGGARGVCVSEEAERARIVLRVETEDVKMWTPYRAEQQQLIQDQN